MTHGKMLVTSMHLALTSWRRCANVQIGELFCGRYISRWAVTVLCLVVCIGAFTGMAMGQTSPPAETPGPPVDYSRIAQPDVAASLMLTPEQKALIAQIVMDRDAASAAAEVAARPAIVVAANGKLQAVLNSDQQRLFVSLFTGKKLRFNFRSQKWADVLDWIAKESDLSLVMETPPPGVFNYSDSKDYTTTESIDLLN
jgi:hypothetical protein